VRTCGRRVISVNVSRISLNDPPISLQSDEVSVSMAWNIEEVDEGSLLEIDQSFLQYPRSYRFVQAGV